METRKNIFWGVLFFGFVVQSAPMAFGYFPIDHNLWARQIHYFLTHDLRACDLYGCYGHPGTTIMEVASLLHILFGLSYLTSVTLGTNVLIAVAASACTVICSLLYPRSPWWLAAAGTLLLNRMYMDAPLPTAVAMPVSVLIVLATWWLWEQHTRESKWFYFTWGAVAGLAIATRLDAALLVATPMFFLLWYRHGHKAVLPMIAGIVVFFFAGDPFLWFMPLQHIKDLLHKFTIHYVDFMPVRLDPGALLNTIWLSVLSIAWSFVLLRQRRLAKIIPIPVITAFFTISILALLVVLSSKLQVARYLFPLSMVWEVCLPLFIMETVTPTKSQDAIAVSTQVTNISLSVVVVSTLMQLLAFLRF